MDCRHLSWFYGGSPTLAALTFPLVPSAAIVSQWQQESKEKVVSLLLSHLPLLQPGNTEAKSEYMRLLQKVLACFQHD